MDSILDEFKTLFREADFQNLIKFGAPDDEYDHEAIFLYKHISKKDSIEDIQQKIWDYFHHSFCTYDTFDKDDNIMRHSKSSKEESISIIGTLDTYKEIAEKIHKLL
jgi:hypothetical protein